MLTDEQALNDDKEDKEEIPKGEIDEWLLNNEQVAGVLAKSKDKNLPDQLIAVLKGEKYKHDREDCIFLLLCKIKPFIWNMQNVIAGRGENKKNTLEADRVSVLFQHIPSMEEFKNNGEKCETSYTECSLF